MIENVLDCRNQKVNPIQLTMVENVPDYAKSTTDCILPSKIVYGMKRPHCTMCEIRKSSTVQDRKKSIKGKWGFENCQDLRNRFSKNVQCIEKKQKFSENFLTRDIKFRKISVPNSNVPHFPSKGQKMPFENLPSQIFQFCEKIAGVYGLTLLEIVRQKHLVKNPDTRGFLTTVTHLGLVR